MFWNEAAAERAWAKTMAFLDAARRDRGVSAQSNRLGRRAVRASAGSAQAEVRPRGRHRDAAARRAGDHTLLDEERLVHVLDRLGLLADADRHAC